MYRIFPLESDHPLFRYFTPEERDRIESIGTVKRMSEGSFVVRAGEIDTTLYTIEDGTLEILGVDDGVPTVFATLGAGDVLGEVSFIDESARQLSARVTSEATIRSWDKKTLTEALAFDPQLLAKFAVAMSELLAERLRDIGRRV